MGYKMKGFSGFKESPVKQKKEKKWESYYPLTEEQKNTPTDQEKDQKKIEQQIEGTYVETPEDVENMKKRWGEKRPKKKK